jgi:hypothetical protein
MSDGSVHLVVDPGLVPAHPVAPAQKGCSELLGLDADPDPAIYRIQALSLITILHFKI